MLHLYDLAKKNLNPETPIISSTNSNFNSLYFNEAIATNRVFINIPDLSADTYYELVKFNAPYECVKIIDFITNSISVSNSSIPLIFSCFFLFHEEGHFINYKTDYSNQGKSFTDLRNDQNREFISQKYAWFKRCYHRTSDSTRKKELLIKLSDLYRENSFEKYADNYALLKLNEFTQ